MLLNDGVLNFESKSSFQSAGTKYKKDKLHNWQILYLKLLGNGTIVNTHSTITSKFIVYHSISSALECLIMFWIYSCPEQIANWFTSLHKLDLDQIKSDHQQYNLFTDYFHLSSSMFQCT